MPMKSKRFDITSRNEPGPDSTRQSPFEYQPRTTSDFRKATMKPILYYDDRSPPVRSCLMLINYLKIDVDLVFIDLFKRENHTPDFININPVQTVPSMQHDHLILTDSHAILIYLAQTFAPGSGLFPKDDKIQAAIINRMLFDGCVLFRRNGDMMKEIFQKRNGELPESHKKGVHEAYTFLETYLKKHEFIAQPYLTIADFSIVTTLTHLDLMFPVTRVWPRLNKWFDRMKELECYKAINEPGLVKMREALKMYAKIDLTANERKI